MEFPEIAIARSVIHEAVVKHTEKECYKMASSTQGPIIHPAIAITALLLILGAKALGGFETGWAGDGFNFSKLKNNTILAPIDVLSDNTSLNQEERDGTSAVRHSLRSSVVALCDKSLSAVDSMTSEIVLYHLVEKKYESPDPNDLLAQRIRKLGKIPDNAVGALESVCFEVRKGSDERRETVFGPFVELTSKDYCIGIRLRYSHRNLTATSSLTEITSSTIHVVIWDMRSLKKIAEIKRDQSLKSGNTTCIVTEGLDELLRELRDKALAESED